VIEPLKTYGLLAVAHGTRLAARLAWRLSGWALLIAVVVALLYLTYLVVRTLWRIMSYKYSPSRCEEHVCDHDLIASPRTPAKDAVRLALPASEHITWLLWQHPAVRCHPPPVSTSSTKSHKLGQTRSQLLSACLVQFAAGARATSRL
jgi:hypothetical protein